MWLKIKLLDLSLGIYVLSEINMLKVEDRAKQLRLNHVFNVLHELAPQYLNQNLFKEQIATHIEQGVVYIMLKYLQSKVMIHILFTTMQI